MNAFHQVDRRRYSEQVVQTIKTQILSNKVAIGDKLPNEKELIVQFHVSRTVVREALRVLEESGLVEIKKGPKGGVFVTRVFHKPVSNSLKGLVDQGDIGLDHLFDVRLLVEPHIAAEAAVKATADDLQALKALIQESANHQDDVLLLKRNNINFHLLLAKAARNPVLSILMESVAQLLEEFTQNFSDLPFGREHFQVHRKLLELIEKRRAGEASKLISQDILRVREKLRRFLRLSSSHNVQSSR
jgi:GntR family transcriptional repressor for pyruvate dehydrogenase complex